MTGNNSRSLLNSNVAGISHYLYILDYNFIYDKITIS